MADMAGRPGKPERSGRPGKIDKPGDNSVRIIAGELRGRRVDCMVNESLRPTPQRTREALFSILGGNLKGEFFVDVFAGTGVVGMEALSRHADRCWFIEKDPRLAVALEKQLKVFRIADRSVVSRLDAYRWAESWQPSPGNWTVFLSPPFPDLTARSEAMLAMLASLQEILPPGGVLILQAEECPLLEQLPRQDEWRRRKYGRNLLWFWHHVAEGDESSGSDDGDGDEDDEDDEDEADDIEDEGAGEDGQVGGNN